MNKMKAYEYNRLVREYKRRIAINKAISNILSDKNLTGFYRQEAEKDYERNDSIICNLLAEILKAKKDGVTYVY